MLHAAVVWTLLPHGAARPVAETPATIEIEMITQEAEHKGKPATSQTQPPPSPTPSPPPSPPTPAVEPQPVTQPQPPAPERPTEQQAELPPPAPPAEAPQPSHQPPQQQPKDSQAATEPQSQPTPPAEALAQQETRAPPGPPSPPASVNLGNGDEDQDPLSVRGDNVVPAKPDALVHNKPPIYPIDAVRRHAEGTVGVRIHVMESGTPAYVDVLHSSGDASLDQSVREAVMLWRFQPASDHGMPVPFDYVMNFDFNLTR